jgi:hypothetical protein
MLTMPKTYTPTDFDHKLNQEFKEIILLDIHTLEFKNRYNDYHARLTNFRTNAECELDAKIKSYHKRKHILVEQLGYDGLEEMREELSKKLCEHSDLRNARYDWHTAQNKDWYNQPFTKHL